MGWGIGEQLQVVRTVFVVGGDEEGHEIEEELLAICLVTEKGISVHDVQLALTGMRQSVSLERHWLSSIQQQQIVEPSFDLIVECIPNRVGHGHLFEPFVAVKLTAPSCIGASDLLDQFKRK